LFASGRKTRALEEPCSSCGTERKRDTRLLVFTKSGGKGRHSKRLRKREGSAPFHHRGGGRGKQKNLPAESREGGEGSGKFGREGGRHSKSQMLIRVRLEADGGKAFIPEGTSKMSPGRGVSHFSKKSSQERKI